MAWVAVVLVLFAATVLRERPARFSSGAVVAGMVAAFALVVANPGEMAARSNLDRASDGVQAADADYLARLGADAVPTIVERLDELPAEARCELGRSLLSRWGSEGDEVARADDDWRDWNAARGTARRAVRSSEAESA